MVGKNLECSRVFCAPRYDNIRIFLSLSYRPISNDAAAIDYEMGILTGQTNSSNMGFTNSTYSVSISLTDSTRPLRECGLHTRRKRYQSGQIHIKRLTYSNRRTSPAKSLVTVNVNENLHKHQLAQSFGIKNQSTLDQNDVDWFNHTAPHPVKEPYCQS